MDKEVYSSSDLAALLGFSVRRLQQLTKEIPLPQAGHGKYDLTLTIKAYVDWIKEKSAEKSPDASIKGETLMLTRAKRQKAELELKMMMGELHKSGDVMAIVGDMVATVRSRLLDLPAKLAPQMIAETDIDVVRTTIQKEINTALKALSEYDPAEYARRNKDYVKAGEPGEEDTC